MINLRKADDRFCLWARKHSRCKEERKQVACCDMQWTFRYVVEKDFILGGLTKRSKE